MTMFLATSKDEKPAELSTVMKTIQQIKRMLAGIDLLTYICTYMYYIFSI